MQHGGGKLLSDEQFGEQGRRKPLTRLSSDDGSPNVKVVIHIR